MVDFSNLPPSSVHHCMQKACRMISGCLALIIAGQPKKSHGQMHTKAFWSPEVAVACAILAIITLHASNAYARHAICLNASLALLHPACCGSPLRVHACRQVRKDHHG